MKRFFIGLFALGFLTACGGESFIGPGGGGTGGGGSGGATASSTVPASVAAEMVAAVYDQTADTLSLDITGLDSPDTLASFTRDATLDIVSPDGTTTYRAFRTQTTTDNRFYLAYFAEGYGVQAGAAGTEIQFGSSFGGTNFRRTDLTDIPSSGSAVFRSGYVGIIDRTPNNLTDRGTRVLGDAFMSVNLTEGTIEGGVSNRAFVDAVDGTGQLPNVALPDIQLLVTQLNGVNFLGDVLIGGVTDVGDYAGVLAGNIANAAPGSVAGRSPSGVAATMVFNPYGDPIKEWGGFIAPVCGGPSASPTCP